MALVLRACILAFFSFESRGGRWHPEAGVLYFCNIYILALRFGSQSNRGWLHVISERARVS